MTINLRFYHTTLPRRGPLQSSFSRVLGEHHLVTTDVSPWIGRGTANRARPCDAWAGARADARSWWTVVPSEPRTHVCDHAMHGRLAVVIGEKSLINPRQRERRAGCAGRRGAARDFDPRTPEGSSPVPAGTAGPTFRIAWSHFDGSLATFFSDPVPKPGGFAV